MNNDEAVLFAHEALTSWGVHKSSPRLIKNRENAVFEVCLLGSVRAALRLHRPGYQSDDAIRSELIWSQGLVQNGMAVPCPIPTVEGDLIAHVDGAERVASVVSWSAGVPLGEGGEPFEWGGDAQLDLHFKLGCELAKLHRISDALVLPDRFERSRLDVGGLLGDAPLWGRFWENAALSSDERALLQAARKMLVDVINTHQNAGGDFGLIHADALRENVLVQYGEVCLIDFDDGAYGFRLYELGVAMSQNWELPNAAQLARALCDGYGTKQLALVEVFTVLRVLASCGWVISRYAPDDPVTAEYAGRAVRAAKRFVGGMPLFG